MISKQRLLDNARSRPVNFFKPWYKAWETRQVPEDEPIRKQVELHDAYIRTIEEDSETDAMEILNRFQIETNRLEQLPENPERDSLLERFKAFTDKTRWYIFAEGETVVIQ